MSWLKPLFYPGGVSEIIHCTTQKVASQWFKNFLSDSIILKGSGLKLNEFNSYFLSQIRDGTEEDYYRFSRDLYERGEVYDKKIQKGTIASPMYMSYNSAKKMLTSNNFKLFFCS